MSERYHYLIKGLVEIEAEPEPSTYEIGVQTSFPVQVGIGFRIKSKQVLTNLTNDGIVDWVLEVQNVACDADSDEVVLVCRVVCAFDSSGRKIEGIIVPNLDRFLDRFGRQSLGKEKRYNDGAP